MKNKILVIGDCNVDVWVKCSCDRLAPEASVPIIVPLSQSTNYGMAGNVYQNLIDLGADAHLICNSNKNYITKTRYVDNKTGHMFIRIDSQSSYKRISSKVLKKLNSSKYDAVIISDYDKGFLTEEDIAVIAISHPLTFLDTKKILGNWARDITFIKINRKEYAASQTFLSKAQDDPAVKLIQDNIIETMGEGGCSFRGEQFPVKKVDIKDLSGAGDSFLAALAFNYIQTHNIRKAITYANKIATIVVQKPGVSTVKS